MSFYEVFSLGGDGAITPTLRTPEQTVIGIFWSYDGARRIGDVPRLYNQIARAVAVQKSNSEIENARYFALVHIAMADAGIATWDTKYNYEFWRPIIALRRAGTDENALTIHDRRWTPVGSPGSNQSPPRMPPSFPAYVSGPTRRPIRGESGGSAGVPSRTGAAAASTRRAVRGASSRTRSTTST
ncbi:vanadium-dependent haloperoxidase [Sorangium cellulosum]|uniref:vanadium-dependent haloperoxidase n=1 Tax=Sorangium cellulosum TaxID=56 RepID=UPI000AB16563|nr:vanadium-dependent haloperoxidase [Sorangium cellulosum]